MLDVGEPLAALTVLIEGLTQQGAHLSPELAGRIAEALRPYEDMDPDVPAIRTALLAVTA